MRVPRYDVALRSSCCWAPCRAPRAFSGILAAGRRACAATAGGGGGGGGGGLGSNNKPPPSAATPPLREPTTKRAPPPPEEYEGLTRWPQLTSVPGALRCLDWVGTCAFAVSGSMLAGTYGLSALGCTVVGMTTALGGGAIRDFIFGTVPVSFIEEYEYLIMAAISAAATFVVCYAYAPTAADLAAYDAAMFFCDTIGIGAFCVIAVMFAARRNFPMTLVLLCTLLTCTGGGMMRDLIVGRPVRVLNTYLEAYAETVLCGACVYMGLKKLRMPLAVRCIGAWTTVVALRCLATYYNFSLPQAVALRTVSKPPVYPR